MSAPSLPSALLKKAGIILEPAGADFVKRAAAAVTWFGRYPVPKRADQMVEATLEWSLSSDRDVNVFRDDVYYPLLAKFLDEFRSPAKEGTP
jgi:hypothetical protein